MEHVKALQGTSRYSTSELISLACRRSKHRATIVASCFLSSHDAR
jgi:hypothetical protein